MKQPPLFFALLTSLSLLLMAYAVRHFSQLSVLLLVFMLTGLTFVLSAQLSQRFKTVMDDSKKMSAVLEERIRSLETSRRQIESIVQHMAEGVLAIGADSELLLANPAALEILSIETNPIGSLLGDFVRPPELVELYKQTQGSGRPQSRDVVLYAPTERNLRVQAVSYPIGTSKAGVLMVLHDITDLKRLESVRRDFVANVSHELKTPLTVIRASVETLLDSALNDPDHGRSFIESIAQEANRLNRLVDDLLELARVEQGSALLVRVPVDIPELIAKEIARHQASAKERKIQLKTEVNVQNSPLGDPKQLSQALSNLLENAIKYNQNAGWVAVRAFEEKNILCIEVKDNGIGIPQEDLPRVFERFYRVDKAHARETGGTGLGLSIVKHIAEAHGGFVRVESQLQQGSCFIFCLPILPKTL